MCTRHYLCQLSTLHSVAEIPLSEVHFSRAIKRSQQPPTSLSLTFYNPASIARPSNFILQMLCMQNNVSWNKDHDKIRKVVSIRTGLWPPEFLLKGSPDWVRPTQNNLPSDQLKVD